MNRTTRWMTISGNCVTAFLLALSSPTLLAQGLDEVRAFDIEAQPLDAALIEFSEQAGLQLMVPTELVADLNSPGVNGEVSASNALVALLDDMDLRFQAVGDDTVALSRTDEGETPGKPRPASIVLMAQNRTSGEQTQTSSRDETRNDDDADAVVLEEIVVTGSNIRGAKSASPVFISTRQDIDQTGVSTLPEFIQTLPQNFGGGFSESTVGVVPSGSGNINNGTGINLRGLGNDSTLVLLNGRRLLAPAGEGNFVDVSMIPLTAIERVEVLTDGASAVYGSDAVGGVVNIRLRDDYEGAETRMRYGTATSGGLDDIQLGQTFGTTWNGGSALISYEYQKRDHLDANDRSFARDAVDPTDILPEQERHSVFSSVRQNLSETVEVFGEAFYSRRDSEELNLNLSGVAQIFASNTEQYGGSVGTTVAITDNWQGELVGTYGQSRVSTRNITVENGASVERRNRNSTNWSLDAKMDGTLFTVPAGDVKLAVGGQYRRETRTGFTPESQISLDDARNIYAAFGEVLIPFISKENDIAGVERLELTVAGRYEDYSDFGSSTDSKLGLLWSLIEGLNLRGTYGTSFRAPLFAELDEVAESQGFLFFVPDSAAPGGQTLSVLAFGNNASLQPETATTWTVGFDIAPQSLQGLNIQATYFNIDFKNRIAAARALFDAFENPRWASVIDRNPDAALLTLLEGQPFSFNGAGPEFGFTDAEALVDNRLRNLASVQTSGLDATLSYDLDSDIGTFAFNLGGTYLFEQLEQLIETDEPIDLAGTAFNPPDLKLRTSVSWAYKGVSGYLAVKYVDGFQNIQVDPAEEVSSWTTSDLSIGYDTGDRGGIWGNTNFSFSALNLLDEDPPFVSSFFGAVNFNFDPANASPAGRTIAFQITKQW